MKKLLIILTLLTAQFAHAQWWLDVLPIRYESAAVGYVLNPDAPCNKNGESFIDFRKEWNKGNYDFRKERLKITDNTTLPEFSARDPKDMLWHALSLIQRITLVPRGESHVGRNRGFSTYFAPSENFVGYCTTFHTRYGLVLIFERIDGKWYLTNIRRRYGGPS